MKTNELSKQVLEKYQSAFGYKEKLPKIWTLPQSTVKCVIKSWKGCGTTTALPRESRPSKGSDRLLLLFREATKWSAKANLKELVKIHSSCGEICSQDNQILDRLQSWTSWKRAGPYGVCQKGVLESRQTYGGKKVFWSDETKVELFGFGSKLCVLAETAHCSSLWVHHLHTKHGVGSIVSPSASWLLFWLMSSFLPLTFPTVTDLWWVLHNFIVAGICRKEAWGYRKPSWFAFWWFIKHYEYAAQSKVYC